MSDLRLIPLGVGEAFTARHYTQCLALGLGDDWLLIDCPHPIRKMMREASEASGVPLDLGRVRGCAVTHLHADHACGLEDFGYYNHFVLGRRARLLAHPAVSEHLWDGMLSAGMGRVMQGPDGPAEARHFDDFFELTALDESAPVRSGPFAVECRRTIHAIPTTALRITAGGRTLGVSADTAYDPALLDWLAPADLIVHEATTAEHTGVHTPLARLLEAPAPLRARLRLIHYPDDFDTDASPIEPLRQGRVYAV